MGGRYTDTGQYDHHVWTYRTYQTLMIDLMCYGSSFMRVTTEGIERIPPEKVIIRG